jgi:Protein of unknown function (DUF2809)
MKKTQLYTLFLIFIIVPLGFATKFYNGWGEAWINNSLGGVLYVIFWCLVVFILKTKIKPKNIVIGVLLVTSFLETLQLWHPPFLQRLRSSFIGVTILGNSFVFSDFGYYIVGAIIAYCILKKLGKTN